MLPLAALAARVFLVAKILQSVSRFHYSRREVYFPGSIVCCHNIQAPALTSFRKTLLVRNHWLLDEYICNRVNDRQNNFPQTTICRKYTGWAANLGKFPLPSLLRYDFITFTDIVHPCNVESSCSKNRQHCRPVESLVAASPANDPKL